MHDERETNEPEAVDPYAAPKVVRTHRHQRERGGLRQAERLTRLGAHMLDSLVLVVPVILIMVPAMVIDTGPDYGEGELGVGGLVSLLVGLVLLLGLFVWNLVLMARGQTLGKKMLGIQVYDQQGNVATFGRMFFLRTLVGQMLVGLVVPFWGVIDPAFIFRSDRRTLHDHIAGTQVGLAQPKVRARRSRREA